LQQILNVWTALDTKRRITVAFAAIAMFAAILFMAQIAGKPSLSLLYSGLDPAVSGKIVAALEQSGVTYQVRGDAIYVDASRRDRMRMSLAEQGLPSSGSSGYELLDNLSGFGTTSQMFNVAYWRAKEGELARTILVWPQIKLARVHIANPPSRPFGTPTRPVASVTVKLSGGALSAARIHALRFLVASAVSGLAPKDVSVIDADRGLLTADQDQGGSAGYAGARALRMKQNIERLLAARVGAGNAVVELSLDTSKQAETIVQHSFDPQSRVAISTDTEETSGSASGNDGSAVTVASNLPSGNTSGGATSNKSSSSKTRERVNYEVSETTRKLTTGPGKVNRISVAVLVNGITDPTSGKWVARQDSELASLQELVKSAIGFDAKRGDVVTIKSMKFPPLSQAGTSATPSMLQGLMVHAPSLIEAALLALVVLVLGLFVIRPALANPERLLAPPGAEDGLDHPGQMLANGASAFPEFQSTPPANDPVAQLREIISSRQEEAVQVLRNWVETGEGEQIS